MGRFIGESVDRESEIENSYTLGVGYTFVLLSCGQCSDDASTNFIRATQLVPDI